MFKEAVNDKSQIFLDADKAGVDKIQRL